MADETLDQVVKGAPPPHVSGQQMAQAALSVDSSSDSAQSILDSKRPFTTGSKPPAQPTDPTAQLPSAPPQIYLNLLILEASLRSQYLALRARRRLHVFSLTILTLWTSYFGYVLFFRPREDGKGIGGSPYWLFDMGARISFMGGVLTFILIYATGQWDRGVRWPRRWLAVTNRGLRGMNLKVVIIKGSWWSHLVSNFAFLFPYSSLSRSQGSSFRYVELSEKRVLASTSRYSYRDGYQTKNMRLEDLQPGGDFVKLLLLPKPFSPKFRDDWEKYRADYWEEENRRRADLRRIIMKREKDLAKQKVGWLRWTGWHGWRINKQHEQELARTFNAAQASQHSRQTSSLRGKTRRGSVVQPGKESHSRSSSRSSTVSDYDPNSERRGSRRSRTSQTRPGGSGRMQLTSSDGVSRESTMSKRASMVSSVSSDSNDPEQEQERGMSAIIDE